LEEPGRCGGNSAPYFARIRIRRKNFRPCGALCGTDFCHYRGGPTGVEMAGAIAEIARYTLARDFRNIDPSSARVVLIEGEPQVLATFPEDLRVSAMKQLRDLGVEIRTGVHATGLTEDGLKVGNEFIPCRVKIWAAGNNASFVGKSLGVSVDQVGRVVVQDDLTIPAHPEVQVIGDLAKLTGKDGKA